MIDTYIKQILRFRIPIIFITLFLVVASGWGMQFLTFKTDYRTMFSEDNPQLEAFDNIQNNYTKTDSVFFVIKPHTGDMFSPRSLQLLSELTDAGWTLPHSIRVDSIANFQHSRAVGDELIVEPVLEDSEKVTPEVSARIKDIVLNEPQLAGKVISLDGKVGGVNVMINLPENASRELDEVGSAARAMRDEFQAKYPDYDFYLTGIAYVNFAMELLMEDDMRTLIPIMTVVVFGVLLLMLRSFTGTIATLFVVSFSIVTAMGVVGWLGYFLTGPSGSASTIILTMAVADCVHILVTYYFYLRQGETKKEAMTHSLKINLQPVFLTSLTTAIGFLTMNFSDVPPFGDLGNIVAIGVLMAFIFSITFLPAIVMILPGRIPKQDQNRGHSIEPFTEFVIRQRTKLLWGTALVSLLAMAFIPRNEIDDDFVKFMKQGVEAREASDFASKNLSGFYAMEYSIASDSEEGIYDPHFLRQIDRFSSWLQSQPEVAQVTTISDVFKRLNKNMHGDDESWYRLPTDKQLSAQYLLLYEMSLPFGLDLNNQVNFDKTATRIIVTLKDQSTKQMLALENKYENWLKQNMPDLKYSAASTTLMFSHIGITNAKSMLIGTTLALLLISLILVVAFKSPKLGLLSVIPNLMPAALAFGVWAIISGQVGMSLTVAIGMTMGIVVDNTVHFLSKYLRARREQGYSAEQAVRFAFSNVGVALLVTNFVLIAGFLVLAQSNFTLNSSMGSFTALTFFLALVVDFLFLPPLLLLADNKETSEYKENQNLKPAEVGRAA